MLLIVSGSGCNRSACCRSSVAVVVTVQPVADRQWQWLSPCSLLPIVNGSGCHRSAYCRLSVAVVVTVQHVADLVTVQPFADHQWQWLSRSACCRFPTEYLCFDRFCDSDLGIVLGTTPEESECVLIYGGVCLAWVTAGLTGC